MVTHKAELSFGISIAEQNKASASGKEYSQSVEVLWWAKVSKWPLQRKRSLPLRYDAESTSLAAKRS